MLIVVLLVGGAVAGEGDYQLDRYMDPHYRKEIAGEKIEKRTAQKGERDQKRMCDGGAWWACYKLGHDRADTGLLRRACDGGIAPACTEAATALQASGSVPAAQRLFRRGCKLGDVDACEHRAH